MSETKEMSILEWNEAKNKNILSGKIVLHPCVLNVYDSLKSLYMIEIQSCSMFDMNIPSIKGRISIDTKDRFLPSAQSAQSAQQDSGDDYLNFGDMSISDGSVYMKADGDVNRDVITVIESNLSKNKSKFDWYKVNRNNNMKGCIVLRIAEDDVKLAPEIVKYAVNHADIVGWTNILFKIVFNPNLCSVRKW